MSELLTAGFYQALRQAEIEFLVFANASYFPFAQLVTDMCVSVLQWPCDVPYLRKQ